MHICKYLACKSMTHQASNDTRLDLDSNEGHKHASRAALRQKTNDLTSMLACIEPDNLHPEQDTGPSQGNEEW